LLFEIQTHKNKSYKLLKLSFVISGSFTVSREDLRNIIEDNGGKNMTSISSKTSFLISGEKMGLKKKEKAIRLNVPIISEFEFYEMLK